MRTGRWDRGRTWRRSCRCRRSGSWPTTTPFASTNCSSRSIQGSGLHDSTATVSLTVVQPTTPPPSTGLFFKGFQLFVNRRRPLASKLRLDFGGNPSVQSGVFLVQVGALSFKVRVAVSTSGADTFVDLSVIPPRGKVALTPRLPRQLQGAAQWSSVSVQELTPKAR